MSSASLCPDRTDQSRSSRLKRFTAAILPQRAPFGLAEGAPANFVAFERDPLEDLESITRVSLRVKGGRELQLAR